MPRLQPGKEAACLKDERLFLYLCLLWRLHLGIKEMLMYKRGSKRLLAILLATAISPLSLAAPMVQSAAPLAPAKAVAPVASAPPAAPARPAVPFSARNSRFAENPIVYFLITDRFYNGNADNDRSYGRKPDGKQEIGTFHGGDLKGITAKLKEGYFRDLGVNALWITAPYEQIHGWVVGGKSEFQHYAYHGYFALDFTVLDKNMGTPAELREMIDTAHQQGIRILFDVVMNHPGYGDLWTLQEYKINVANPDWDNITLQNYHKSVDYNSEEWAEWWGPNWVRAGLGGGYSPGIAGDDQREQVAYLPDFITESAQPVKVPEFFRHKADTRVKNIPNHSVRQYLVKWLTDWVREYGVDGFRCDTAKHVDLESWALLKQEGTKALREWKKKNPQKKIDDADFWMVGEVFPHGVVKDAYFTEGRFDSLLNFDFQGVASNHATLDETYSSMTTALSAGGFDVLSYISSHDTRLFDRKNLINGGTSLLLAPGGVQIFYGDETARPTGPFPRSDRQQATRSFMNWSSADATVLKHWQTLTQFRLRHPAIARGLHRRLASQPYVFSRSYGSDRIIAGIGVQNVTAIPVGQLFAEGSTVRDAYTGAVYRVENARVKVTPAASGVVLLEAAD